jgi:3-deoxy-D-manno-octulosonic-acid transferase
MYLLYSLALSLGVIALLPRFILDAIRHGKYVAGFSERLGGIPHLHQDGRTILWLHCVSVGETQAARPLVHALLESHPSLLLVVSTTTLTGQRVAREAFGSKAVAVIYFPFDWRWTVRRALRRAKPSAVLIMETEIWPNFLHVCAAENIPVAIVNGRLSETSFRRYRLLRGFIGRVLRNIELAVMQTREDAARIEELGLSSKRVKVSGNIKFDIADDITVSELIRELDERFISGSDRPLVVAASTHDPEEMVLLECLKRLNGTANASGPRLLIAPRHPERFREVAALIEASGFSWSRRSDPAKNSDKDADIILLDTIGELRATYALADVVFVGGSIARRGGHNVLEPAAYTACIITGAHTENFAAIVSMMREAGALLQLPPASDDEATSILVKEITDLLSNDVRRTALATAAREVLELNRGATDRTLAALAPLLGTAAKAQGRPAAQRPVTQGSLSL